MIVERDPSTGKSPDLSDIIERGAIIRRMRLAGDLRILAPSMLITAAVEILIYSAFMLRAGRNDWGNLILVSVALAFVPLICGILLTAMRQHQFPITTAAMTTFTIFNFAIAVLSVLRIPLSYAALLSAMPFVVAILSYGNVRLHKATGDRIGLLTFSGALPLKEQLKGDVTIIDNPNADLSRFDRILIDSAAHHNNQWSRLLTRAYMLGLQVTPWISFMETRQGRTDIENFDIFHLSFSPSQIYYSKAKRIIDVTMVIASAPVTLPVAILIWLYILVIDGSPAIFVQERRGYGGKTFKMLKFRTMYRGSDSSSAQTNDHRIIPGCRFLRLMRLDELPQLINIIRGDMSWVGPRPVSIHIAEACEASIPQYSHRQLVLPGLTGWAQVTHGYASSTDEEIEKLAYDLYYVKRMSFDLDLLICAKTVRTLLLWDRAK